MAFQRTFSKAPWEKKVGYCRAVKAGPHIAVTGTAPVDDEGEVFAPGDAFAQAQRCFVLIERALHDLGATKEHIIRTRMFVTDIAQWEAFGRAHRAFFEGDAVPAATMVEIKQLIDPRMLIEIEADAYCVEDE